MSTQTSPNVVAPNLVTADSIAKMFKDAPDPLSFIQANLRQQSPNGLHPPAEIVPVPNPSAPTGSPAAAPAAPIQSFAQQTADDFVASLPIDIQRATPPAESPAPSSPAEPPSPSEPVDEDREAQELLATKGPAQSIKDLRRKANELKRQLEEREGAVNQLKETVTKYETGEAIPEVVKKKDEEIEKLRYYQRLHALEMSPEYQEAHIKPLETLKSKAVQIAKDYEVEPTILDEAIEITNKRDRNRFLREHFDEVGALEVRGVLEEIETREAAAEEAKRAPQQTLEELRQEFDRTQREREGTRVNNLRSTARDGWIDTLTEMRDSGRYPEVTLTGNPEHDELIRPLVESASQEYGKWVKLLADSGAKPIPKEAAKIIAKRFLLSQIASVAIESRNQHLERADQIINESRREASFVRPQVGGIGPGGSPVQPKRQPNTLDNVGDRALGLIPLQKK